jgi:hypothetical protein
VPSRLELPQGYRRQTGGVFLTTLAAIKLRLAHQARECIIGPGLPGVAALRGRPHHEPVHRDVAFPTSPELESDVKVGVLLTSTLLAIVGRGPDVDAQRARGGGIRLGLCTLQSRRLGPYVALAPSLMRYLA